MIVPAAQGGHHTDLSIVVSLFESARQTVCVCVWACVCACKYKCLRPFMHTFFSQCSISLPHKSVHVRGRALLSLSNWWSFQIKMNLHHANRGSGEQSASSLQSAGIAGGLSLLSSGLLSLNPLATLPVHCKPTAHTEFTAAQVSVQLRAQLLFQWQNHGVLDLISDIVSGHLGNYVHFGKHQP